MKDDKFLSNIPIILPSIPSEKIKAKSKGIFRYLGPAFIVSVAYMDPPNTTVGTWAV